MEIYVFEELSAEEKKHVEKMDEYIKMFRLQDKSGAAAAAAGASTRLPSYLDDLGDPDDEFDDGGDVPKSNYSWSKTAGQTMVIDVKDGQDPHAAYEEFDRCFLVLAARMSQSEKHIGPEKEQKTCIWPGCDPVSWNVLSSGYSWVGVNGSDTTCVVSIRDPICKRPPSKIEVGPHNVVRAALADMIAETPFSFRHQIPQSAHAGPVAVVSVAPCLPGQEFQQATLAIDFLKEKLKDRSSLSSEETEQIALCALKYVLGQKFQSDKIVCHGWKKGEGLGERGRISEERILHAINHTATMDLTASASSMSLSSL